MKQLIASAALVWFALAGSVRAQADGALNGFRNHALPVLVKVDSKGHVTDLQPAVTLTPRTRSLLRSNLQQMIVKPAMHEGRPVSSVFIMQLALKTRKVSDGTYAAHFQYVSSTPVPFGNWYWVHINGHRLALAEDSGRMGHRAYDPFNDQDDLQGAQPGLVYPQVTSNSASPIQAASHSAMPAGNMHANMPASRP